MTGKAEVMNRGVPHLTCPDLTLRGTRSHLADYTSVAHRGQGLLGGLVQHVLLLRRKVSVIFLRHRDGRMSQSLAEQSNVASGFQEGRGVRVPQVVRRVLDACLLEHLPIELLKVR